jgi:hypothetical protein
MTIEKLKAKTTTQQAELSKTTAAIHSLKRTVSSLTVRLSWQPVGGRQLISVFDRCQRFLTRRRISRTRPFYDKSFKFIFWSIDYWLSRQFL